jgi:hypothetical protein
MDMRKATARIPLDPELVTLTLDSESLFVMSSDTPVIPDGSIELVVEGYIDTEETLMPGEPDAAGKIEETEAIMLRGSLIPISFRLDVIG